MVKYIETPKDWWEVLDQSWDNILLTTQRLGYDLNVLATNDFIRNGKYIENITRLEDMIQAKQRREWERLHQYLSAIWRCAPDEPWIHTLPSWGEICDLCSETWVFWFKEEENDEKF